MRHEPYPDCPGEELVREVAAEIAPPEIARRTLQHISQCDHCGPLLKSYREAFSEELSPEIEAVLRQMPSAGEKARRKQAKEIVRRFAKAEPPPSLWEKIRAGFSGFRGRAIAVATVAGMAVVASVVWGPAAVNAWELHREQKLVAAAYAERRTTPMRLTAVDFGDIKPVSKTLGSNNGIDLQRPVLLKATTGLAEKLKSGSKVDPRWLQIKGRLALLADPDAAGSAEESFEEAQSQGLQDPSLEIDMAVSYFARAAAGDGLNVTRAIDLLEKVLKQPQLTHEQRAVALFDLAIAYEQIQAWDVAVASWEKYLAEDHSSGPWAQEAQERLKKAKVKLPPPKTSDFRQPDFFLRHSNDEKVLNDIEQFQEFAFGEWLPKAIEKPKSDYAQALAVIAKVMEQRHSDTWWKDFLRAAGPQDLSAVRAFSEAYTADKNDLHFRSLEESREAAAVFARNENRPGELMALFQQVYALQRVGDSTSCMAHANQLSESLKHTSYRWLQGQVALEKATCANMSSAFQLVDASLEESRRIADITKFDFPELRLRIIGINAGMLRRRAKYADAWRQSISGLGEYWTGAYSAERLYQFYSVMRQCAGNIKAVNASEALLRQSIHVFESDVPRDGTLQALLYLKLASLLLEQDNTAGAEEEADKARSLLTTPHADDGTGRLYDAAARIELASFELRRKEPERALAELNEIAPAVSSIRDNFLKLDFYKNLGFAELQLNHFDEALASSEQAIDIADEALRGLKNGEGQLHWMQATNDIYRGVVRALLAKKDDEKALAVWEWARSRTFDKTGPPHISELLQSSTPKLLQALSATNQNRVVYASFEDSLQVWVVQGTELQSKSVPIKRSDLQARARQFAKACSSQEKVRSISASVHSERLYDLLLKPVVARLSASKTIVVEPDEAIDALPFQALRSPEGWYFGERYSFIYSPGVYVETALRVPSLLRSHDRLVAIDGSMAGGSDYLPGHDTATEAVRQIQAEFKLFPAPTTATAVSSELRGAAGLSFFGHAVSMGTGAALKLGPNSFLGAQQLHPKLLGKMQFAVLAACSSGTAENGLLDSDSLVRAFLAGGVPTVVASRWNVESQSTAEFVQRFYSHLATESAPEAMRDARKEMRLQHPYYWAGFNLSGRTN